MSSSSQGSKDYLMTRSKYLDESETNRQLNKRSVKTKSPRVQQISELFSSSNANEKPISIRNRCTICRCLDSQVVCSKCCTQAGKVNAFVSDLEDLCATTSKVCTSIWDNCVACRADSGFNAEECSNFECPSFFKRTSARNRMKITENKLREVKQFLYMRNHK